MNLVFQDSRSYVEGATAPAVLLRVEAYPSDPTGATVTFEMADLFTDIIHATGGTPSLGTVTPVTRESLTTYDFDLEMAWGANDLDAGLYYGRFTLTDDADVYVLPSGRNLIIEVLQGMIPDPE